MSPKKCASNTFGWARLEIVGALANSGTMYILDSDESLDIYLRFSFMFLRECLALKYV